jgi:hypothetical protein
MISCDPYLVELSDGGGGVYPHVVYAHDPADAVGLLREAAEGWSPTITVRPLDAAAYLAFVRSATAAKKERKHAG